MKKGLIGLLMFCLMICVLMLSACEDKTPADTGSKTDASTNQQVPTENTTEEPTIETIAPPEVETDPDGGLWSPVVQ